MRVKVFIGNSTKEVLDTIKAELGSEAVILGSREIFEDDGRRMVEVTAGTDKVQAPMTTSTPQGFPGGWDEWHKEWSQLKNHIYTLMQPAMQWENLTPHQRVALEYIQKEGVERDVIVEFYNALVRSNREEGVKQKGMLSVMASFVPVKPFTMDHYPEKYQLMVGPYGSGKTTSALRLAMLRKDECPHLKIGFINADVTRGNGRIVLRHWADLSGFPYFEAPDSDAMKAAMKACRDLDCIFIDMPGLSKNELLTDSLDHYGLNQLQAQVHLVLSPYFNNMKEILRRYSSHLPADVLWTKLDEVQHYGELINVAVKSRLPISALSYGASLQGSLSVAEESQVWKLILKHQLPR